MPSREPLDERVLIEGDHAEAASERGGLTQARTQGGGGSVPLFDDLEQTLAKALS